MAILGQPASVAKPPALSKHLMNAKGEGKATIIILCWDQVSRTKTCIESICRYSKDGSYQLIVVNNGSFDETSSYLMGAVRGYQDIIISNVMNRGFSGGNNQALRLAECEYVLFLNSDCIITGDNWLEILIKGLEGNGVVGPSLAGVRPRPQQKTFEWTISGAPNSWDYVEGWCLFGKRELFLELDGFDLRFNPGYSEDSDLSFRVRGLGQTVKRVKVPIKHSGNASLNKIRKCFPGLPEKNNKILFEKWLNNPGGLERLKSQSILIKRKGARGDVLMTTPIIKALKKKFPNSTITFETDCVDVLAGNTNLTQIAQRIKNTDDYGVVLTPRYEEDPNGNAIDVMAKQCDISLENRKMEIALNSSHLEWARNLLNTNKPTLAIHTGGVWKAREWPLERFREVIQYFINKGYDVLEFGDARTRLTGIARDFRGHSIKQSAAAMSLVTAFLGVDSLCSNLAKAVGVPAFIIYGCTSPVTRVADAEEIPIWLDDLECRGCRNRTTAEFVECSQREILCLTGVSVDMVIKTMDQYIMQAAKPRFFNM